MFLLFIISSSSHNHLTYQDQMFQCHLHSQTHRLHHHLSQHLCCLHTYTLLLPSCPLTCSKIHDYCLTITFISGFWHFSYVLIIACVLIKLWFSVFFLGLLIFYKSRNKRQLRYFYLFSLNIPLKTNKSVPIKSSHKPMTYKSPVW